ncbi:MAG: serine/threonine protein kinase [Ignavibacteria bacterium]|nr:serine/threonine protein kinase [Ignavibacteria bacterium]
MKDSLKSLLKYFEKERPIFLSPKIIEYQDLVLELYCSKCHANYTTLISLSIDTTKKQRQRVAEVHCPCHRSQFNIFYEPGELYAHMLCAEHGRSHRVPFVSDAADEATYTTSCDVCKKSMQVSIRKATESDIKKLESLSSIIKVPIKCTIDMLGINDNVTLLYLSKFISTILAEIVPKPIKGTILFYNNSIRICLNKKLNIKEFFSTYNSSKTSHYNSLIYNTVNEELVLSGKESCIRLNWIKYNVMEKILLFIAEVALDTFSKGATWMTFNHNTKKTECFVDVDLDSDNIEVGYDPNASYSTFQWKNLIGLQINDYLLRKRIGGGASSDVFLSEAVFNKKLHSLPEKAALKIYKSWIFEKFYEQLLRIDREVSIMRSIRHKNLVRVYDRGNIRIGDSLRIYIIMEVIDGQTLTDWLKLNHPLSENNIIFILIEICNGIISLHEKGIFHRDIKPDNIMIRAFDNTPIVLDFGVIKVIGDELTDSHEFLGTRRYAAPEYLFGFKQIDFDRVDVYGVGGIAYSLIEGCKLFPEITNDITLIEAVKNHIPKIRTSNISEKLKNFTYSMLDKTPKNRPKNIHSVIKTLRSF